MTFLKKQFNFHALGLNHDNITDFYLSCFQRSQKVLPLLFTRILILLCCLTTLVISLISDGPTPYWLIYMTNWGVFLINLTSGFAVIVSCVAFYKIPFESLNLPWYVKTYWALMNMTITVSIFITVFYYSLLFDDQVLTVGDSLFLATDFLTHAINCVLMLILLLTSRTPIRILHVYFPVGTGLVYLAFSAIYYVAGGTTWSGDRNIYPVLDWSEPGPTLVLAAICVIAIAVIHLIVVVFTCLRDFLTKSCNSNESTSYFM